MIIYASRLNIYDPMMFVSKDYKIFEALRYIENFCANKGWHPPDFLFKPFSENDMSSFFDLEENIIIVVVDEINAMNGQHSDDEKRFPWMIGNLKHPVLFSLMHEFEHYIQFKEGRIEYLRQMGNVYSTTFAGQEMVEYVFSHTDYIQLPWEKEANTAATEYVLSHI